ncbi:sigma-70 family RNA polymerase sigma factor [Paenibacillus sp. MZ04-78.2]|uniref:sigma-70 family RNA polymerase sigma factor n=1 Tax=Paenibacillus sp. MZ04-78.2 TaxID=2962034 RepID=UPI0020B8C903|nr:sigma-70 family RNA polymerase sigma factor [Paenibacillus sp. MZ04-78.2]MCP3775257.1 sigma-70 family RNA polymerase sigma factor [Paenibacillus sp. MZ04-78.2]
MLHWIEQAKQGDREAFDLIVRRFTAMAHAVAYERLRDSFLAEDAVQESFAEAFIHLRKLKEAEAFPGWFKTIVIRQCNRLVRKKRHPTVPFDQMVQTAGGQPSVPDIVERKELQQWLHDSIAALSPGLRMAVQLFYFHGYTLQEISAYSGTPVPTLKKRLFDARAKLKGTLPVTDFVSVFHQLYEGGKRMLHIVNGDVVAEKLRQGVVQGDILVWRELYPEGPVFTDSMAGANRSVRARYLEQSMGIPSAEFTRSSEEQEKVRADFRNYEEIVLWFEHDLFDQTMLCCLLHWFAQQSLGATKLSLLCIGAFPGIELFRGLGQLSVNQMATLSGTWQTVGKEQLELGKTVWEAYCAPEPDKLVELLEEGDTSALPYVQDAFRLHLSRFPSTRNGLGIVEQTTLEMVRGGMTSPLDLFDHIGNKLHGLGMGDIQYWHRLAKLSQGPHPLLKLEGLDAFPGYKDSASSLRRSTVALTEAGRKVLDGEEDWIALNGTDEWYGGVHLQGRSIPWRWDASQNSLVPSKAAGGQ